MLKRNSFYAVVVLFAVMFMAAGCSTQNVVKKDEGIVPAAAGKSDQSTANSTPQKQTETTSAKQSATSTQSSQTAEKASSAAQLQSALQKIYFDFDSAGLSEPARGTLTKNAAALMKLSSANIRIEGNCDERGSAEYNLALGERRANSARQYLMTLGVKPENLSTISYGKEKPAVRGSDEAAMAKNRRDEFVVITK